MRETTYVGLDVHHKSIAVVWGKARQEAQYVELSHTDKGVDKMVERVGTAEVWGVYEACGLGFGLLEKLRERGWRMDVVAPTHIARSTHGRKRKTDRRDAEKLQQMLMAHGELGARMPKVWIPDRELQEHRELVRRRLKLGENASRIKVGILSLQKMHQIKRPESIKTLWTQKHIRWLKQIEAEAAVKLAMASQIRELEFVIEEQARLQEQVQRLAERPRYARAVGRMTAIKGVGILTAMTFLLELGDPKRFKNRRQVSAYLGLVPASYESGEAKDRKGHITRMGPSRVRKVLNQAAWAFLRENDQWRQWYEQVAKRRGKKKALVGLMRRLGIKLWAEASAA